MDIFVDNLVQIWDDGGEGILALDGITHHFGSGKLTCLLGPSGCGKSTLVQIIGGIEHATRGTIRIVDPGKLPAVHGGYSRSHAPAVVASAFLEPAWATPLCVNARRPRSTLHQPGASRPEADRGWSALSSSPKHSSERL